MKLETLLNSRIGRCLLRSPRALWRGAAGLLGTGLYLFNVKGCRRDIVPLVAEGLKVRGPLAHVIAWKAAITSTMYAFDSAQLLYGSPEKIRAWNAEHNELRNVEDLARTAAEGKGVILAASYFSCFYYAMMARWPAHAEQSVPRLHLVRPAIDPLFEKLYDRVRTIGCRDFSFIEMGGKRTALDVIGALRRGDIVICMVDHIDYDMMVVPTRFFGRASCLAAGYLMLADRTGAPILPCITRYENGRFVTSFGPPIVPAECPADDRVTWLANQLNDALEQEIRRDPGSWEAWGSLKMKWHFGQEITG